MIDMVPDDEVGVREALPGADFAVTALSASRVESRLYAGRSSSVGLFGVAGGAVLVSTVVYLGGAVLLAEVKRTRSSPDASKERANRRLGSDDESF